MSKVPLQFLGGYSGLFQIRIALRRGCSKFRVRVPKLFKLRVGRFWSSVLQYSSIPQVKVKVIPSQKS